jgi:biopolymer transport protein ExbB
VRYLAAMAVEIPAEFSRFLDITDPFVGAMWLCSLLVTGLAIERWANLRRVRAALRRAEDHLLAAVRKGDLDEARRHAEALRSPVREVFTAGLDRALGRVTGEWRAATRRESKRVVAQLRSEVWILGTAGALMPFVGLLGTVLGVMSSFHAISESGQGGFAVVSGGISAALVATAAGLAVALEAVVFYNLLQNSIAHTGVELGILIDEMSELIDGVQGARAAE